MQGMKGLCVQVEVDMKEKSPKDLEKVGVYGFVTYDESGESVLANNPDKSTDAGQFAMIESVTPSDTKLKFEFIAAIPKERVSRPHLYPDLLYSVLLPLERFNKYCISNLVHMSCDDCRQLGLLLYFSCRRIVNVGFVPV